MNKKAFKSVKEKTNPNIWYFQVHQLRLILQIFEKYELNLIEIEKKVIINGFWRAYN